MIDVFAPGKLVLLGEYAVLDGAPAVVAAVDRGVRCRIEPAAALHILTPDADDRFVRPALHAAHAPAARYTFTAEPAHRGPKLGLGSSAAATVAAVLAARVQHGEPPDPADLRDIALRVHRQVQGSGSGLDVTASAYGGLCRVQGGDVVPLEPLSTPLSVVYSGAAAATGPRVERYLAWAERQDFVELSTQIVCDLTQSPVEALRRALAALRAMAAAADIDYLTPALERIVALAHDHGGAAKPSGAGGGDIAVALIPDPQARDAFLAACRASGLPPIPLRIAPGAAPVESER